MCEPPLSRFINSLHFRNVHGIAVTDRLEEMKLSYRSSKSEAAAAFELEQSLRASTQLAPNHTNQDHSGLGRSLSPEPQIGDATEPDMVSELQLDLSRSPAERDNARI